MCRPTATDSADKYGYMYQDNKVEVATDKYEPLFKLLNQWSYDHNTTIDSNNVIP